ncbi:hypothetical protein ACFRDV_40030 [Streptomyces fagopyri]|uniref:hypothetical protein n=1 Tax=Streptomyces fagopyri TaxID=2662397 RepID=UPI0036AEE53E
MLSLAEDLGTQLRSSGQIAAGLTCTIRYADADHTARATAALCPRPPSTPCSWPAPHTRSTKSREHSPDRILRTRHSEGVLSRCSIPDCRVEGGPGAAPS